MKAVHLLSILVIVFMMSCSQSNTASQETVKSDSVVKTSTQTDSVVMAKDASDTYKKFNAIVLSTSGLYTDSSMKSGKIRTITAGEQVNIESKTNSLADPAPMSDNPCETLGYYWFQITTATQEKGWAYGQFLLQKGKAFFDSNEGYESGILKNSLEKKMQIDGKTFWFDAGVELNAGSFNSEGLTGCDTRFYPYFYDESGKIFYIHVEKKTIANEDFLIQSDDQDRLMMVLSSEGGALDIKNISSDKWKGEEVIVLSNDHSYQDGGADSNLYIAWKNNHFEVIAYIMNKSKNQ